TAMVDSDATSGMRYEEIRKLLKDHFGRRMAQRVETFAQSGRLNTMDRQTVENSIAIAEDAIAGIGTLSLFDDNDEAIVARWIELYSLDIKPGSSAYRWLQHEMGVAYRDYNKAVLAYDASLGSYDFDHSQTAVEGGGKTGQWSGANVAL
ncbi:MAG: hypothetical protein ACKVON_17710, partial [Beijerinckiaceae bacterium]